MANEAIDYGYVIKRSDDDYVAFVDLNDYHSGYNVVPKTVDPYNAYDIDDLKAYCEAHHDHVLTEHPLQEGMNLSLEYAEKQNELDEVNRQLFEVMCQDFANRLMQVQTLPENTDAILELFNRKNTLEQELASLEKQINDSISSITAD